MPKYIVLRDCYGFKGRLWEKGEIVELEPNEQPPRHFQLLTDEPKKEPPKTQEPATFSGITIKEAEEEAKLYGSQEVIINNKRSKKK